MKICLARCRRSKTFFNIFECGRGRPNVNFEIIILKICIDLSCKIEKTMKTFFIMKFNSPYTNFNKNLSILLNFSSTYEILSKNVSQSLFQWWSLARSHATYIKRIHINASTIWRFLPMQLPTHLLLWIRGWLLLLQMGRGKGLNFIFAGY